MPSDLPRESKRDMSEGVPWQVIYASFLGVTLCTFALYGGMYLSNAEIGWVAVGGVAAIIVALGVATNYVALLTGVWWSIVVCRISMPFFAVAALATLAWGLTDVIGETYWEVGAAAIIRQISLLFTEPQLLIPLLGVVTCTVMIWFLFGRAARRFFDR